MHNKRLRDVNIVWWAVARSPRALKHSRIALWVSEWVVCRVHCSNASLCLSWLWLSVWYLTDFLSSFSKTEFHLFRLFRFGLSSGLSLCHSCCCSLPLYVYLSTHLLAAILRLNWALCIFHMIFLSVFIWFRLVFLFCVFRSLHSIRVLQKWSRKERNEIHFYRMHAAAATEAGYGMCSL